MRCYVLFSLLLALGAGSALAAEPYHVRDDVKIFVHTGPSNQYRIKARISSGTGLSLLERNQDTGYVHVRTDNGTDGWVDGKLVEAGISLQERLPKLESQLDASRQKVASQAQELVELRSELENTTQAGAKSTAEVAQLQNEVERLKLDIDKMDEHNLMGWLLRGGGIALAGVILGLIIPHLPKKRRRTDDWF